MPEMEETKNNFLKKKIPFPPAQTLLYSIKPKFKLNTIAYRLLFSLTQAENWNRLTPTHHRTAPPHPHKLFGVLQA